MVVNEPEPRSVMLGGYELSYLDVGDGPALLFVHGIMGSHRGWARLVTELSSQWRVIAPDLFGHGLSAKPLGDYSLGAHAATLRDLLDELDIDSAIVVGHSLGGGVAMQFEYLFPGRISRLILVDSGGLGREVSLLLRAATLPGAELVLPVLASPLLGRGVDAAGRAVGTAAKFLGAHLRADTAEGWHGIQSLADHDTRQAFLATARSVINSGGQTVSAKNRLYRLQRIPVLIIWGSKDPIIPVSHGHDAQDAIPGSRLEIFDNAGHFPHLDDPNRFVTLLRDFNKTG
jgi:pimeloyl-ACP methyl ester carboxylesterase